MTTRKMKNKILIITTCGICLITCLRADAEDRADKESRVIPDQFERTDLQQESEAFKQEIQDLFPSGQMGGGGQTLSPLGFKRSGNNSLQGLDMWINVNLYLSDPDHESVSILSCFRNTRTKKEIFLLRPARYEWTVNNVKYLEF